MRTAMRRTLKTLAAVAIVVTLALSTTTVVNAVATGAESNRIETYGQRVPVDGREMNVLVTGAGAENVVMIPGFGTSSPVRDFAPLVSLLAEEHRVIVVEPFGYGLSDGTDRERTTANIVTEIHSALQGLGIDRYTLMGHSIAGIYGIEFARRYPEEVQAFVGIDSSVPGQPGMDAAMPTGLLGAAKFLGLARGAAALGGDGGYAGPAYTDSDREQIALLTNRHSLAPTYLDEMGRIASNFARARDETFPVDLPLLLFVVAANPRNPDWIGLHERQAAAVADGTVVPLDGDHYLHHTQSRAIAEQFRTWEVRASRARQ